MSEVELASAGDTLVPAELVMESGMTGQKLFLMMQNDKLI